MSGIYIDGFEMPIGHNEATFGIDADGHPICIVYTEENAASPEIYDVIPVPDHGRLIDANANINTLKKCYDSPESETAKLLYDYALRVIEACPAVIPADEEIKNENM